MEECALLIRHYLLFFLLPLWIIAGFTDYVLHKQTRIEETAGTKESILHAVQLGEAGIPALFALLLDINALIIVIMLTGLLLHEITAIVDVSYASRRRYVSPFEHHVHSFMEILPLIAVSLVTTLYWNQFVALFGIGSDRPRFELHPKAQPISTAYLLVLLTCIACFIVLPYAEELWRCLRAAPSRRLRENTKHTLRPSQAA
jgi:hypothetical protein